MSLTEYKQKRRFESTPEPSGVVDKKSSKKLEFVVQKHHASQLHYDFRLELDGVLKSWAVPKGPSMDPKIKHLAMMVEDHPFEYRKFEGVIPKGNYGAGNVIIWDKGTYEPRIKTNNAKTTLQERLKKGHLTFILHGQKLKGEFALIKTQAKGDNAWLLVKKGDEFATHQDITQLDKSVISGRRVDDLAGDKLDLSTAPRSVMPKRVKPMLASLIDEPFDDDGWLYEIKWDGYRAIGCWDGRKERLYSRNGLEFTAYKQIGEALRQLSHEVVLDGEVVVADEKGKANFGWLQDYASQPRGQLLYYVFDILWCDGYDLTNLPLIERKSILRKIIPEDLVIKYSDHILGRGIDFFEAAQQQQLEGIMAKHTASHYLIGRRAKQWLKIKTHMRQEAVIAGFTEPKGSRKHLGALILGVYEKGELRYIGHTGGGIPTKLMPKLRSQLESIETSHSPFVDRIKTNAPAHWVKPKLVCEVKFSEWTDDGHMRHPVFISLRDDKEAKAVQPEKPIKKVLATSKPAKGRLEFSHLDKVFFPEASLTKGDLVDYYQSVAKIMLPYIKDRPHSLLRQPNGINQESFFQKDMGKVPDWIKTVPIFSESNNKNIHYLVPQDTDSLLYMVQLGSIEINPWNSRIASLEKPDWCVIDLDPEDISFREVIKAAKVVHDICKELNIASYPKTSGKTGIHVYIPLAAKYSYEQCRQFAQLVANLAHERLPETTSLVRNPKKRQQKIYLDYLQNRAGQTLAAPYSVRPTPNASVSTPLNWDEVNHRLNPAEFTIKTIIKRLDTVGDIWKPVIGKGIDIGKAIEQIG